MPEQRPANTPAPRAPYSGDAAWPKLTSLQLFSLIFTAIFLLHAPLLRLPYFWDEAGYYIPAAYDFFKHYDLIPHSTLATSHPPLGSVLLGIWWKFAGFRPSTTRIAMLLIAAFAMTAVFRLARFLANTPVALATTLCTAIFPVWFAQSSLAHADLLAAALTLWGLVYYFEWKQRPASRKAQWLAVLFFALAALAKETAVITPVALALWDTMWGWRNRARNELWSGACLLLPGVPLALWFLYQHHLTGYFFGDPDYFRYNVRDTVSAARVFFTLLRRLWQLTGYMGMFVLTLLTLCAIFLPPRSDSSGERPRIALPAVYRLTAVIVAYLVLFSFLGGAVLARYMLPVFPLVVLMFISTLLRRLRWWKFALAFVLAGFLVFLFHDPFTASPPEDSLLYRDFVLMHKRAAGYLAQHYAHGQVLTAWPGTDELTKPELGYTNRAMRVVRIENFSFAEMSKAAQQPEKYDVVFIFSTKHHPVYELRWKFWEKANRRYYDYHDDLTPEAAAQLLGGTVVWQQENDGLFAAILDMQRSELAETSPFRRQAYWRATTPPNAASHR